MSLSLIIKAGNWCRHDFAVVETIDFFEDEDQELPLPMTQKDVILLNRAGAFQEGEVGAQAEAEKADDDAMEVLTPAGPRVSRLHHLKHPLILSSHTHGTQRYICHLLLLP